MKKLLLVIGIMTALFATSCKKDNSVSGGDTPKGDKNECFYFEAVDAGSVVSMKNIEYEAINVSLEYSTDKTNWSSFVIGETSVTLAKTGDRVYIRAKGTNNQLGVQHYYSYFTATEKVKVGGNIMFLLDCIGAKDNFDTLLNKNAFRCLFSDMTSLTDASSLVLPATTLAYQCYESMFAFCTALTTAPALPATVLASGCYCTMFKNCTALKTAPTLPATTLAKGCYCEMFKGCTSLVVNTEVPGTTWHIPSNATSAEYWNKKMFEGTGGNFTGEPEIGVTYYIASDVQ